MAAGLPVIAVAAGGLLDIMTQPGVTGDIPERRLQPAALNLVSKAALASCSFTKAVEMLSGVCQAGVLRNVRAYGRRCHGRRCRAALPIE